MLLLAALFAASSAITGTYISSYSEDAHRPLAVLVLAFWFWLVDFAPERAGWPSVEGLWRIKRKRYEKTC